MGSASQRQRGYLLPETITGLDTIMVCLCIPDDPYFRAAFRGAITELTKPWSWEAAEPSEYPRQREAAQVWLKLIEETLSMPCEPCQTLAECIASMEPGSDLDNALRQWLIDQITNNSDVQDALNGAVNTGTSVPASLEALWAECDTNLLFGFIKQLVQFLNVAANDWWEVLEVATNAAQLAAAILDNIPVLSSFTDYVEYMRDAMRENYQANYDAELENRYACELLCYAKKHDCALSWSDLRYYFMHDAAIEFEGTSLSDFIDYVVAGFWDGDEIVSLTLGTLCLIIELGSTWAGYSLNGIIGILDSFRNDPDSDWTVLCGACPWRVDYLYEWQDPKDWTIIYGAWDPSPNPFLQSEHVPGVHETSKVERNFTGFDGLTAVWADGCKIAVANTHVGYGVYLHIVHGGGVYDDHYVGDPDGANVEFDLPVSLDNVTYISIEVREDTVGDGGFTRTGGITLFGTGYNPPPEPPE